MQQPRGSPADVVAEREVAQLSFADQVSTTGNLQRQSGSVMHRSSEQGLVHHFGYGCCAVDPDQGSNVNGSICHASMVEVDQRHCPTVVPQDVVGAEVAMDERAWLVSFNVQDGRYQAVGQCSQASR